MTEKINLKEMERKAFRSTFADGLTDILIGIYLLIFTIGPLLQDLGFGDFWSSVIFMPIFLIALYVRHLIKRKIIVPRLGTVTFGAKRKQRVKTILVILSFFLLGGILVGVLFWFRDPEIPSRWLFPGFLSVLLLIFFSGGGFFMDLTRFYIYAFIGSLGVLVGELLFQNGYVSHHGYPVIFGLLSTILIITGAILFKRFLTKYPRPGGEASHE